MHIAEVVTIAKSLPLLRLNTYKSLILSYSADSRRILDEKVEHNRTVWGNWAFWVFLRMKNILSIYIV